MQKIIHGINHLEAELNGLGKMLLVCDGSYPFLSIKDDIENIDVEFVVFDQFSSNPLYEDVCKGVELFRCKGCNAILAVGGGSSIDVAKCIKLFCKMDDGIVYLQQPYADTEIKLIAIPTTAGTGSESTRYAVIYYEGKKQSVTHESIIPDVAILEPAVLKTLPVYQKKCTMLDALCQGIESWWSINSTDESKAYSRKAVEKIVEWWEKYIVDNDDEAAAMIMDAANTAGKAINITQTTAAHAMSYKITSLYGLPHGHAVAVCLPEIWEYMNEHISNTSDARGADYLRSVFEDIATCMGCESVKAGIRWFRNLMARMDMKNPTLNDASELDLLTESVNPVRLKNNPVLLEHESIYKIYGTIIK